MLRAFSQGPGKGTTLRIVLVEDNDDNRETLEELLRLHGHQVWTAADGVAGVELIASKKPDVSLVDVGLPGLDGFGVARRVRAQLGAAVRLIAFTGYGTAEDKAATAAAGFDDHLVKPVDPDVLLRKLLTLSATATISTETVSD